jgi:eukaryotic-like serine/threonine-protein kinase
MDKKWLRGFAAEQGLTRKQTTALEKALESMPKDRLEHMSGYGAPVELNDTAIDMPTLLDETCGLEIDASKLMGGEKRHRADADLQQIGRYEDLGLLGKGGMGEIRKIRDMDLNRSLAMKIIHPKMLKVPSIVSRFIEEAQVGAQLQHPSIIPVHEIGTLPDGRFFFTMKEIKGRDFSEAIREVHSAASGDLWQASPRGWSFQRLIGVFLQACSAVAYAHSKGVIHRDLKPGNIMLGAFGEVLVVDWGIAKIKGRIEHSVDDDWTSFVVTDRAKDNIFNTQFGQVAGTPAYMSPEQAMGQTDQIDHRSDIYSLGAILYEILTGREPFTGQSGQHVLQQVMSGPPLAIRSAVTGNERSTLDFDFLDELEIVEPESLNIPEELVEACERAMERAPEDRYQSAKQLTQVIQNWLDGSKKRAMALEFIEEADKTEAEEERLRGLARTLRTQASDFLKKTPIWETEDAKVPGWKMEDEADALEHRAEMVAFKRERLLQSALTHKQDLPEAHMALCSHYLERYRSATLNRDKAGIQKAGHLLQEHAEALPAQHEDKIRYFNYLRGDGLLTLETSPKGCEAILEKFLLRNRRLVPLAIKSLGKTPLIKCPLERGSYRIRIRKKGYHEVLYPISIDSHEHWRGLPPGADRHEPIWMPPLGSLLKRECYVPGGWFWSGGDPQLTNSLPKRRIWIDSFVIRRFQVTNQEYIDFLNALVANGRESEALKYVPREKSGQAGKRGTMIYGRKEDGQFHLTPDSEGDLWMQKWPVCMVDWHGAKAYAEWEAKRTGIAWRLPYEMEWEKAARGVDGRLYVWGDRFDPSWGCMRQSHPEQMLPAEIDDFPIDESPYRVRGMAGNMMDWTLSQFREEGPPTKQGRITEENIQEEPLFQSIRGGHWLGYANCLRAADRSSDVRTNRGYNLGFRLLRPIG